MKSTHLASTPFLYILVLSVLHVPAGAESPDEAVMHELKNKLSFLTAGWGWWSEDNPCKWEKVQCVNKRVTQIQIGGKFVSGTLPDSINQLTELQVFEVMHNSITGPIPSFFGLSKLKTLLLNDNKFSEIPSDFFNGLTSLQAVYLDNNPFKSWKIPETLKQCTALQKFSAISANVTGTIPSFLGSKDGLSSLTSLDLSFNNLEGGLPDGFSGSSIQKLWVASQYSETKLTGSIAVLQNMTSLVDIWLANNMFTGPIPDLSSLKSLKDFSVMKNQLTGPVPYSLMNLPSLKAVRLSDNLLQGKMPKFGNSVLVDNEGINKYCSTLPGAECDWRVGVFLEIARPLWYPTVLARDWGGNDPCTWAEVTCDSAMKNVTVINFQNKSLMGTIALEFSKFTTLQRLHLNNNRLTGKIPDVLAEMPNLVFLDVSYNNIFGQLPKFRSNVVVKYDGTNIGKDDPVPGTPPSSNPSTGITPSSSGHVGSSKYSITVGIVLGSLGGFMVICVVLYIVIKRRKRRDAHMNANGVVVHPHDSGNDQHIKISIAAPRDAGNGSEPTTADRDVLVIESGNMVISIQVLRAVTNNFSKENVLGRGGFGTVYKGGLNDGTKIAVKRMETGEMSDKGLAEFQAEIDVLTKVRHRHLVNLLGHCLEGNEKLLVYEYMPQGTLSRHLFNWAKENLKPLEWSRRLTIALDVARGVEYLHSLAHQSFVHRDLKPSNILLGDDMHAKVADFGLVHLAPDGKNSFATKVAGTFGYLAPEYAATGRVTTKIDVFSFGVILMELITGRKAIDNRQSDESCHLATWFRKMSIGQDTFQKSIDPVIDLTKETLASIQTVAELAGYCSVRDPHQRPDMSHAVTILSSLAELWKPTKQEEEEDEDLYGNDLKMTLPQVLKKWQQGNNGNGSSELSSTSFWDSSSSENTQTSISPRP